MQGILYVATGDDFVKEARKSARTVSDVVPVDIALVSDTTNDYDVFDRQIELRNPEYGFRDKINGIKKSPFDETIYLDTDIYALANFEELFDLLTKYDLLAAYNHDRSSYELDGVPEAYPEYNTGVLGVKKPAADEFLDRWLRMVDEDHPHDQPGFRKATYESEMSLATITPEYNAMLRYPGHLRGECKLAHNRLLDIDSPGASQEVDTEPAVAKLNRDTNHRVYIPSGSLFEDYHSLKVISKNRADSWYKRLKYSIKENGLRSTLSKLRSQI